MSLVLLHFFVVLPHSCHSCLSLVSLRVFLQLDSFSFTPEEESKTLVFSGGTNGFQDECWRKWRARWGRRRIWRWWPTGKSRPDYRCDFFACYCYDDDHIDNLPLLRLEHSIVVEHCNGIKRSPGRTNYRGRGWRHGSSAVCCSTDCIMSTRKEEEAEKHGEAREAFNAFNRRANILRRTQFSVQRRPFPTLPKPRQPTSPATIHTKHKSTFRRWHERRRAKSIFITKTWERDKSILTEIWRRNESLLRTTRRQQSLLNRPIRRRAKSIRHTPRKLRRPPKSLPLTPTNQHLRNRAIPPHLRRKHHLTRLPRPHQHLPTPALPQ